MNPETIVKGVPKPAMTKERIIFGAYDMVYTKTTKNMIARRVPGISLCDSNNLGGRHFMNLYIGRRIDSNKW